VDDVAVDYPDVKFVICHLGNPWFQDTAEVLYKNDNVYADISGLTLGDFDYDFERYMVMRVKDMIMYMGDPGSSSCTAATGRWWDGAVRQVPVVTRARSCSPPIRPSRAAST
jgi:hypothetical protein